MSDPSDHITHIRRYKQPNGYIPKTWCDKQIRPITEIAWVFEKNHEKSDCIPCRENFKEFNVVQERTVHYRPAFAVYKSFCVNLREDITDEDLVNYDVTDDVHKVSCDDCLQLMIEVEMTLPKRPAVAGSINLPIEVSLGETISVNGQHFILTDFMQSLGEPITIIFRQPSELISERKQPSELMPKNEPTVGALKVVPTPGEGVDREEHHVPPMED